jgi:hypothetical protein
VDNIFTIENFILVQVLIMKIDAKSMFTKRAFDWRQYLKSNVLGQIETKLMSTNANGDILNFDLCDLEK